MSVEYAIIVKNKTRLESLIERFNTKQQARFYIERSGADFSDYEAEHDMFHESLSYIQRHLSKILKNKIVDRSFLPSFIFNNNHVVLTVGQDGLVANTAKYAKNIPLIAINPDVNRYDGVLLPFNVNDFTNGVNCVLSGKYNQKKASFAEARLNDGQRLLAFNDLFIGASSHISFRYKINNGKKAEEHSSSGILVSTKMGSTGWLSSVFNMSEGIEKHRHGNAKKYKVKLRDEQLMYIVREPFLSKMTQTDIIAGAISGNQSLIIESHMPANGVIFSDGIESDFLNFNAGAIATISVAKEKALLVLP